MINLLYFEVNKYSVFELKNPQLVKIVQIYLKSERILLACTSCPLSPLVCSTGPLLPSRVKAQDLAFHQVAPVWSPVFHDPLCLGYGTPKHDSRLLPFPCSARPSDSWVKRSVLIILPIPSKTRCDHLSLMFRQLKRKLVLSRTLIGKGKNKGKNEFQSFLARTSDTSVKYPAVCSSCVFVITSILLLWCPHIFMNSIILFENLIDVSSLCRHMIWAPVSAHVCCIKRKSEAGCTMRTPGPDTSWTIRGFPLSFLFDFLLVVQSSPTGSAAL